MELPLINRLKKRSQKTIALAQDILIIELYNYLSEAVIHGGTSMWRCYGGNRFSEDIDVYLPLKYKNSEKIKDFINGLKRRGFSELKFREKENSIYSNFKYQEIEVKFEAVFKNQSSIIRPLELSDGSWTNILTLSAEALLNEKIATYEKRRKIRDLYDIYILLNFAEKDEALKRSLLSFIKNFSMPLDESCLKTLIISGAVPKTEDMLKAIKKWAE